MRAPLQILAIPYRYTDGRLEVCVLHRATIDQWQFVAGGAEDAETPEEAARREIWEETGIHTLPVRLSAVCSIRADCYDAPHWPRDLYVVPEYSFAFLCKEEITLSHEHDACIWMSPDEAERRLHWDSNKTALYELTCRLRDGTLGR